MAARKMIQLLGHSNAEGFGGTLPLFAAYPQYIDLYGSKAYTRAVGFTPFITESLYKNIKVWTAKSGWSFPGGTPPTFSPAEGTFLDLTVVPPYSPADPYAYLSPYNYPNNRSMPVSPTAMLATQEGGGTLHGIEIPLCWHLSSHWSDTIWLMKLAIPGSLFLRYDQGLAINDLVLSPYGVPINAASPMDTNFSWWQPGRMFDWAPGSGRFYSVWKQRMTAAKNEAVSQGDVLDTRLVILWMGDNDSTIASAAFGAGAADRVRNWEVDYRAFIRQIRKDLEDNEWTQIPGSQVSIMMMGIHKDYGDTSIRSAMNSALQNIARDDPYTRFIDTTSFRTPKQAGYNPSFIGASGHFSHLGYVDAAQAVMDALISMETETTDALSNDDRITREEVRDRVKVYYARGRARTDTSDANDDSINQHISSAYLHIINKIGDQAWWLRRIVDLALSADANIAQTLPRFVSRVLRIERTDNPGYPLHFELQGMTDSGRLQIVLKEGGSGTYRFHCITKAREIVGDQQAIPLPFNLIEWLVVETCRRLARASGNTVLQVSLAEEVGELAADAMRNIAAMQRARQDRLFGQRRLPTRKTLGRLYGSWIWPPQ